MHPGRTYTAKHAHTPTQTNTTPDALIAAIHNDIEVAKAELDKAPHKRFGTTDLEWTTTAVPPAEWRPKGSQEEEGQADGNV